MAKEIEQEITNVARKYAIKNASEYGKAKVEAVLSKVFFELPDSRKDIKKATEIVSIVIKEVNKLPKKEIESELTKYSFAEKKERVGLPDLPWVTGSMKVNTRFAPNPSGFLHIGHSKIAILCDEYAKKYSGNFYVRFEDTDPKTKRPILEAYTAILEDLTWLGCNIAGVVKQSERMQVYYKYAKKLIEEGKAYVCTCDKDTMQENRRKGIECKCRKSSSLSEWEKMLTTYKEGEAILRLKTDLQHTNISVRDWVMFRIIEAEHPITKSSYRVWPLYNFACVIDDHEMQINLVIRGKEHEINQMKQAFLYEILSWETPHVFEVGILRVKGELAHKSDISEAIKAGKLTGWDDPRAPTVMGFRKKGISAEAIRRYIIASGIGKGDSYLDLKKLESFNRKLKSEKE